MMTDELRKRLIELSDEKYRKFNESLIPGTNHTLGVRIPELRRLAREIAGSDWRDWVREGAEDYHEELMIKGMVIGYARMDLEERFEWLDFLVPRINNWAICDCWCATYAFMKKEQEKTYAWLEKYRDSAREYEVRFALVVLLDHFINDTYIDSVLDTCNAVHNDGYYAKMAAAWAISVCFVKFPERTFEFLKQDTMDDFTHNKAIQKTCESYRVSKEMKEAIRKLKR